MKKKIALLLAAVMAFSAAVPMNLFAASNKLTRQIASSEPGDLFVDPAWRVSSPIDIADLTAPGVMDPSTEPEPSVPVKISQTMQGVSLEVTLDQIEATEVRAFRLELTNARWAFFTAPTNFGTTTVGAIASTFVETDADDKTGTPGFLVGNAANLGDAGVMADKIFAADDTAAVVAAGFGTAVAGSGVTENNVLFYDADVANSVGGVVAAFGQNDYVLYKESDTSVVVFYIPKFAAKLNIPLMMMAMSQDPITVSVTDGGGLVKDEAITLSYSGIGTTNTIKSQKEGIKSVELDVITFTEKVTGSIRNNADSDKFAKRNEIHLAVEAGYMLGVKPVSGVATTDLKPVVKLNGAVVTVKNWTVTDNEAIIELDNLSTSSFVVNKLTIENLIIVPVIAGDVDLDKDLAVSVTDNSIGLSNSDIAKAAKFVDWGVYYDLAKGEEVKVIKAGRNKQATAKVELSEKVPNSWWTNKQTQFSLTDADGKILEDVKITSVTLTNENFRSLTERKGREFWLYEIGGYKNITVTLNAAGTGVARDITFFEIDKDGHSFNLLENDAIANQKAKVSIMVKISADTTAEGPVYLQAKNSSFGVDYDAIENNGRVQIAEIEKLFEVSTKATEVQIGAQRYNVKDIVIEELQAGALLVGDIVLELGEFGSSIIANSGLYFVPLESAEQVKVTGEDRSFYLGSVSKSRGRTIVIPVERVSRTNPVTITVEKLEAYVDRTVPNGSYDLIVTGSAFQNNIENSSMPGGSKAFDSFEDDAYFLEGYIKVGTDQDNLAFRNEVRIMDGVVEALVNGEPKELPRHPEFNAEQNRFYVPLTGIATLLGTSRFYWDNDQRVATVIFNDKSVQFKIGSNQYWVAGEAFARQMDAAAYLRFDENGGGYTYIPFAALGDAFAIPTSFTVEDDGTIIGIYNEKK